MSYRSNKKSRAGSIVSGIVTAVLLILVFIVTLATALFLLTGDGFDLERVAALATPEPRPNPTPTAAPKALATPLAGPMTPFRSVALGFAIDYPADWYKQEKTLQIIFSPASSDLDPDNLGQAALWVGIPAGDSFEPELLLADLLSTFPANAETLNRGTLNIAAQPWLSTQIRFEAEQIDGAGMALLAATQRNEVGYLVVAMAPAQQWPSIQPIFQGMLNSFRFTEEVVIRPTDATPPPTPTPTPTPRIYVVQPGDTLSAIAVQFDVSVEELVNRNGLDRPEYLRSGQKLIIPTRRR